MTNTKTKKRALLLSLLAIVLCMAMLIGSTFAWFTDTASTGVNNIQAGNLKVGMYYEDGKVAPAEADWKDAEGQAIFDYTLWEPGYTVAKHIKIANEGSLALKYQLDFMLTGEIGKLAEVIDVYFADPAVVVADRAAATALTSVGTLKEFLEGAKVNPENGVLKKDESAIVTIVLKMNENAGNIYKNTTVGDGLTVRLNATQLASEEDSFDENYDKGALYPNQLAVANDEELAAALANSEISEICLKAGEYAPFTVNRPNVTIKGVVGATAAESSVIKNTATSNVKAYADNVVFDGLWIESPAQSIHWLHAGAIDPYVNVDSGIVSKNLTVKNCHFVGPNGSQVILFCSTGLTFTNNYVEGFDVGVYVMNDNSAPHNFIIANNTFKNVKEPLNAYWGGSLDAAHNGVVTFTGNTVEGTEPAYITLWDYAQLGGKSVIKATVNNNNGNMVYNLTHFDYAVDTEANVTVGTGEQKIAYLSRVAFDIPYADRGKYTIVNADGSELSNKQGNKTLSQKINVNGTDYAGVYTLATGSYKLVENGTENEWAFTVTDPVTGVWQFIDL